MAGSKLKIDIRRNRILEQLRLEGKVNVLQLSKDLGTTAVTIRNDLTALERDGYLLRTSGGAVMVPRNDDDLSLTLSSKTNYGDQKQRIANAVAAMVRDGDTLFINSGTTTQMIAAALKVRCNLNIVTNSLATAMMLGEVPSFRVVLLGGAINATYGFTHGADAQTQLSKYQADWAFLSVDGVSVRGGITTHHGEEAVIDRMMIAGARNAWIAADHTKIGRAGFARVCDDLAHLGLVTTADNVEQLRELEAAGMKISYV